MLRRFNRGGDSIIGSLLVSPIAKIIEIFGKKVHLYEKNLHLWDRADR